MARAAVRCPLFGNPAASQADIVGRSEMMGDGSYHVSILRKGCRSGVGTNERSRWIGTGPENKMMTGQESLLDDERDQSIPFRIRRPSKAKIFRQSGGQFIRAPGATEMQIAVRLKSRTSAPCLGFQRDVSCLRAPSCRLLSQALPVRALSISSHSSIPSSLSLPLARPLDPPCSV